MAEPVAGTSLDLLPHPGSDYLLSLFEIPQSGENIGRA